MSCYCIKISPCFKKNALHEIEKIDKDMRYIKDVAEDTIMFNAASSQSDFLLDLKRFNPIFIKHIAPTNYLCEIVGDLNIDKQTILRKLLESNINIEKGRNFAVQARIYVGEVNGEKIMYSSKDIEVFIGTYYEKNGGIPIFSEKKIINASNVMIISILINYSKVYFGFSTCEENLNFNNDEHRICSRAGGRIISRAENKLIEALSKFEIKLIGGIALDVGAAPGGWTNVLVENGYIVHAVDPAELHSALCHNPNIIHYKCRAEKLDFNNFFDIIVDDMNMEPQLTSEIMVNLSKCLKSDAFVIVTFKLPTRSRKAIDDGINILTKKYRIIGIKSLFHNRQEVTVVAQKI